MSTQTAIDKRELQDIQQAERIREGRTYIPHVDILEKDDRLLLLADMPGVKPESLDVSYERGDLTIHGKVDPRQERAETAYLTCEYGIGDFYRTFRVGEGIDASRIEAELKDGVLTLHLPKAADALPRKITVKSD